MGAVTIDAIADIGILETLSVRVYRPWCIVSCSPRHSPFRLCSAVYSTEWGKLLSGNDWSSTFFVDFAFFISITSILLLLPFSYGVRAGQLLPKTVKNVSIRNGAHSYCKRERTAKSQSVLKRHIFIEEMIFEGWKSMKLLGFWRCFLCLVNECEFDDGEQFSFHFHSLSPIPSPHALLYCVVIYCVIYCVVKSGFSSHFGCFSDFKSGVVLRTLAVIFIVKWLCFAFWAILWSQNSYCCFYIHASSAECNVAKVPTYSCLS